MVDLRTSVNASTFRDVHAHLLRCDAAFVPPLSQRVDIEEYAARLARRAQRFEAWDGDNLLGLVAVYFDHTDGAYAYVSNVSVDPEWTRRGVARRLITTAVAWARERQAAGIRLEVSDQNAGAIALYSSLGFHESVEGYRDLILSTAPVSCSDDAGPVLERAVTLRDHDSEFQDNDERRYSYDFDHIIRDRLLRRLKPAMKRDGRTLELGAYRGDMTAQLLEYFDQMDVIEASALLADEIRARFPGRVEVTTGLFEEVEPETRYDNIFLVHTLEHLDAPVETLTRVAGWLSPGGLLFVVVPNANALSRQIAVQMGLISHNSAVTPGEFDHGHRRTYSLDTLLRDVRDAGLLTVDFGGVIVKPLANYQFDLALAQGIVDEHFIDACDRLARLHPDLSASVFAVCRFSEEGAGG